jgi:pilus assembly protein CpaB
MSEKPSLLNNQKLLLGLSLAAALLGTALIYRSQSEKLKEFRTTVPVVVAQQDIPAGTRLAREMLARNQVPQKYRVPGSITPEELNTILDQRTSIGMKAGQPLLWSMLEVEGGASGLAKQIPAGERALTIAVDPLSTMEGLLRPADRVDLLCTFTMPGEKGGSRQITKILLQNVTVLAAGGKLPGEGTGNGFSTVTLKVSPTEAELITFAEGYGKLRLAVRPSQDYQIQEDLEQVDFQNIFSIGRTLTQQKKQNQKSAAPRVRYD